MKQKKDDPEKDKVYRGKVRIEDNITLMDVKTGEVIEPVSMSSIHVYDTKKDAESDFSQRYRDGVIEAKKHIKEWNDYLTLLQKNPPRSRKRKSDGTSRGKEEHLRKGGCTPQLRQVGDARGAEE